MTITTLSNADLTGERLNIWRELEEEAVVVLASAIYDIATDGAGTIVIVGADGKLAVSSDLGVTWALGTSEFGTSDIMSVSNEGTIWITGGLLGKLASSADAVTWAIKATDFGTDTIYAVYDDLGSYAYGFAGGANGRLDSSYGLTGAWVARTSSFGTNAVLNMTGVTSNEKLLIVGEAGNIATGTPSAWSNKVNTFGASNVNDLAFYSGAMVAVGDDGKIERSTDSGSSWAPSTTIQFGTSNVNGVATDGSKFCAVGDDGKINISSDGILWAAIANTSFDTTNINSIVYDSFNNIWIAVGDDGKVATSSGFLTTWTQQVSGF